MQQWSKSRQSLCWFSYLDWPQPSLALDWILFVLLNSTKANPVSICSLSTLKPKSSARRKSKSRSLMSLIRPLSPLISVVCLVRSHTTGQPSIVPINTLRNSFIIKTKCYCESGNNQKRTDHYIDLTTDKSDDIRHVILLRSMSNGGHYDYNMR